MRIDKRIETHSAFSPCKRVVYRSINMMKERCGVLVNVQNMKSQEGMIWPGVNLLTNLLQSDLLNCLSRKDKPWLEAEC